MLIGVIILILNFGVVGMVKNKCKNDIIRGHYKTIANIYTTHSNRRKFKF